jgi:voltage-dependent potassium channel beta subunit
MEYRYLGRSGLKVSVLSFGSWITFGSQIQEREAVDCLAAAYAGGVNFFDNAEIYGRGESERLMGMALRELKWPRESFIVSTKLFMGITDHPHMQQTLNRKYLVQALDASLRRLQLDFVDILFCHRADPATPIEEVVRTMHDLICSGKILFWGTSAWTAQQIREAFAVADCHHLHKPVTEQAQYNVLERHQVEEEYRDLYEGFGLGLTTWSPLAAGLLTGKYVDGVPADSRAELPAFAWLRDDLVDPERNRRAAGLKPIAEELGCTMAQLAIAWCARNPHVSSVITGASRAAQVAENLRALEVSAHLDDDVLSQIDQIVA